MTEYKRKQSQERTSTGAAMRRDLITDVIVLSFLFLALRALFNVT